MAQHKIKTAPWPLKILDKSLAFKSMLDTFSSFIIGVGKKELNCTVLFSAVQWNFLRGWYVLMKHLNYG